MTTPLDLDALEALAEAATPGPWRPCYHLRSPEHDKKCPCGYRGSVWSGDGEAVVLEMGVSRSAQPDLDPPTPNRETMLTNAALLIALRNAAPALLTAARGERRMREALLDTRTGTDEFGRSCWCRPLTRNAITDRPEHTLQCIRYQGTLAGEKETT